MFQKLKTFLNKKSTKKVFQALKWVLLFGFLYLAFRYFQWDELAATFEAISIKAIAIYLAMIFISRILYAYRWKQVGNILINKSQIPLVYYFQTNLLAEFITIAMPTSLGGEVTRVLKLNNKGSNTTFSTASILIDRALGIGGMLIVSLTSLALLGSQINLNIPEAISDSLSLPVILAGIGLILIIITATIWWLRKPAQKEKLASAWELIKDNIPGLLYALLISCVAHIIFSAAHYFLLEEIYPLDLITTIAVILTPQLARSIPISVLGISAGEGMMVAGQMMIGMSKESALIITMLSLAARYFFALLGFLIEFLHDGIRFFKQVSPSVNDESPADLPK